MQLQTLEAEKCTSESGDWINMKFKKLWNSTFKLMFQEEQERRDSKDNKVPMEILGLLVLRALPVKLEAQVL